MTVTPSLRIADVSEFQNVDWGVFGKSNRAVIVRAHNGYRADKDFAVNQPGARANTDWRAWYQYLPQDVDPVAAAKAFVATVGPLLPGEVVILDHEVGTGDQRPRRQAWLDTVHAEVEWTYSGLFFARQHLPGVAIDWIAAYQTQEPTDQHTLWQFADNQAFDGIGTCDGSIFHGTLADLQQISHGPVSNTEVAATRVNHNTGLSSEKPWGAFPLAKTDWYGINDGSAHSHSGLRPEDKRAVKQIQREVGSTADGDFGDHTRQDVINWQHAHGLLGDGEVGPLTWAKMDNA